MQKGLSLQWRMVLIVAGIPLLLLVPLGVFVGVQYQRAYREAFWNQGYVATIQLEQTIRSITPFVNSLDEAPGLATFLKQISENVVVFDFIAFADAEGRVIEHSNAFYAGQTWEQFRDLEEGAEVHTTSSGGTFSVVRRQFPDETDYLVWRSIEMPGSPDERLYLIVGQPVSMVDPPTWPLVLFGVVIAAGLVILIRASLGRMVLQPLNRLAEGAALVGAGDLAYQIEMDREDEFGFVAQAFNQMAGQLNDLVSSLEESVRERTAQLERRNAQLEAVSLVSQEATQEHNVSALLDAAVNAISDNFGFYHTGIFILDDNRAWAILRAASSEGGKRMLNRGHRLQVGQVGIVGYTAETGNPRVAFNVGQDAVWFNNPDLPHTRSEMALPLLAEGEVVGVLDVQSTEESAFSDEDISTLQLMADQLTVALNNARTLEAMESTLAELRELQVDYSRRGWARVTQRMRPQAYEYDRVETTPVPPLPVPTDLAEGKVPHKIVMDGGAPVVMEALQVGDQVLGYLGLSDPQRDWSEEELSLVRSVGEQVALALDNARLFEDTQRNERQQYLISSVLQVASNPELAAEQVLENIARILAQGLDLAVVIFTFPYPNQPVVHAHAIVNPVGERLPLFEDDLTLSREHFVFFEGLSEPALGPMSPLLNQVSKNVMVQEIIDRYDFERVLYVPISSGTADVTGAQSGFIGLIQSRDNPPLDPETRALAQRLASQIAVVLENLNLTEETRQRSEELRQLYQISLTFSELLEPADVLEMIVEEGVSLLDAEGANLWVYESETGMLVMTHDYAGSAEGRLGYRTQPGQGLAGRALAQRQTTLIEDYATWEHRLSDLISTKYHAMLAIPLVGRFGPLGVLVVMSRQVGVFTPRDAGLADLFSAQAAAALENARLNQDAQQRAEEFSQLYDAGIDLITILDVRELLDRAADWARRVFEAERAVVFMRDPNWEQGYVRGQSASEARFLDTHRSDQPSHDGLTETLIRTRESVLIRDNRESPIPSATQLVEVGLLSQMGTPLRIGEEVLGALFVNGTDANQFGERDLTMLEFLATQISSALQNSMQFNQTEQALSVVGRQARYQANVSSAVALLNERGTEALSEILNLLGEAADVPVVLYFDAVNGAEAASDNGAGSVFWRLEASWIGEGRSSERLEDPRLYHLAVDDVPFWAQQLKDEGAVMARLEDLPPSEREILQAYEFGALLGLAVPGSSGAPGFIAIFRDSQELWEEQEIVVLQTVAAALSNTFAREELFNQVQQTLSETEALYRGGAALSEASTYQEILDVLLGYTVLGQGSHSATLQIFNRPWLNNQVPDHADVVAYWSEDGGQSIQRRYMVDEFPSALEVMRAGSPLFIEDLQQDDVLGRRAHALFERVMGARSLVIVPLVVGGQRIGYLHTDYQDVRSFPESTRRRLISLAQQAAIAVLNIRQLQASEARVRREQLIREITGRIQESADVRGVLQIAVRELGRAFGTSHNRIQFRPSDEDADHDGR